ncbi:methyltransferase domain-containing protein [Patescibacteria group bacterium]
MVKTRSVPAKIYTKEFFQTECERIGKPLKNGIPQRFLYALKLMNLKKGMNVLDVGAGRGELAIRCAQKGAEVKAIDYSRAAVEIAKGNLRVADKGTASRIVFKKMNAKKLIYPDKYFDIVFMGDVVEHLYPEELRQVFLEIKRVLRSGGKVIIRTSPNAWLIKPLYFFARIFFPWWKKHGMHVNEQSFFSLHRNLKLFQGKTRVFFRPRKNTFSGAVCGFEKVPSRTARLAGRLDKLFDNEVISFLIYQTPLVLFLGVNLWAVVKIPKERDDF